jgi:hypothetical protein
MNCKNELRLPPDQVVFSRNLYEWFGGDNFKANVLIHLRLYCIGVTGQSFLSQLFNDVEEMKLLFIVRDRFVINLPGFFLICHLRSILREIWRVRKVLNCRQRHLLFKQVHRDARNIFALSMTFLLLFLFFSLLKLRINESLLQVYLRNINWLFDLRFMVRCVEIKILVKFNQAIIWPKV